MDPMDAILYEHAAQAREIWLSLLPDEGELPAHRFSRRFERRMNLLIRQERWSPRMRQVVLVCKRTVAAILVLLSVSFAGLMTVDACRQKVIEAVVQIFHELTDYRFKTVEDVLTELPDVSFGYVPEGMRETVHNVTANKRSRIVYEGIDGTFFELRQKVITPDNAHGKIVDTETAPTGYWMIRGHEVSYITKESDSTLQWIEQNILYVLKGNLELADLKIIAEGLNISYSQNLS